MATSAASTSIPFVPAAGQAFTGSDLKTQPQIFGRTTATRGMAVGGNVPTVAILAGAGTVGSISNVTGYDQAAQFTLTAGTASINGGSLASVTFGQPLQAAPAAVVVQAGITAGTIAFGVAPVAVSKTGFTVQGGAPVSGQAYVINYMVILSPQS